MNVEQNCRHCQKKLSNRVLDLGYAPPSNAYRTADDLFKPETTLPLRLLICNSCWLLQTEDFTRAEILFDKGYAYFSSTSKSWLAHATRYCEMIVHRLGLDQSSQIVEIASNDGYLLQNFVARNIPCLGVEPTQSTSAVARTKGIPVEEEFFGLDLAHTLVQRGSEADLIIGNNVYAHVPDINDFTAGMAVLLKPEGVITLEFPHLLNLLKFSQFDTVYHEHYSYLSLTTVQRIFSSHGLRVFDCEQIETHGGSLRIFGCFENASHATNASVAKILDDEADFQLTNVDTYGQLQSDAEKIKNDLLMFLIAERNAGRRVAVFGAAAKGNTLMNYAGIGPDLISFVCDSAEAKQNKFCPGSHIPIVPPSELAVRQVDTVIVFAWNILPELTKVISGLVTRSVRIVTAIPEIKVCGLN
jgi:hypothetical protein